MFVVWQAFNLDILSPPKSINGVQKDYAATICLCNTTVKFINDTRYNLTTLRPSLDHLLGNVAGILLGQLLLGT